MSDVFISYARSTEREANDIAQALRALGYGVWRDDALPAHRDYSEVIEERLRAAKAVVVVWSTEAVKSQWVRAEADIARQAGTLVQLTLDGTPLPLPFNRVQCADLRGWRGDPAAAGWRKVAESVAELMGGATPIQEAGPQAPSPSATAPTTPDTFSVALAPFADPAGAAAGDDFADGLVAEIATALARFRVVLVMDAGPASLARYRLEGSVRRSGPRVRINIQLRDAVQGERVWAEGFDGGLDDPFAFQDDVAARVAGRVEAAILTHETRRIAARPVESLSAHELGLRARETVRRAGLEQVDEVEALSERAVALDPGHAPSLAFLATAVGFRIAYAGAGADLAAIEARFAQAAGRAMVAGAEDPDVLTFVAEAHLPGGGGHGARPRSRRPGAAGSRSGPWSRAGTSPATSACRAASTRRRSPATSASCIWTQIRRGGPMCGRAWPGAWSPWAGTTRRSCWPRKACKLGRTTPGPPPI